MSAPARAVEHQPFAPRWGCHEIGSTRADAERHIIHVRDRGFESPRAKRQALKQWVPACPPSGNQSLQKMA